MLTLEIEYRRYIAKLHKLINQMLSKSAKSGITPVKSINYDNKRIH